MKSLWETLAAVEGAADALDRAARDVVESSGAGGSSSATALPGSSSMSTTVRVLSITTPGGTQVRLVVYQGATAATGTVIALGGSNTAGCTLPDLLGHQFHPPGDPWRTDISAAAVHPDSAAILAWNANFAGGSVFGINAGSGDGTGTPIGFPYVVVAEDQAQLPLTYDPANAPGGGPPTAPIPALVPVEGVAFGATVPAADDGGDHHLLVLVRDDTVGSPTYGGVKYVWELYSVWYDPATHWNVRRAAIRHSGQPAWNDRAECLPGVNAGGTLLVGGLVTYAELARAAAAEGDLGHALRFDMHVLMNRYLGVARAGSGQADRFANPYAMPSGTRLRLKAFDLTSINATNYPGYTSTVLAQARAILRTIRTYGMVADDASGSSNFELQGTMDAAWGANYPRLRDLLAEIDAAGNLEVLAYTPGFAVAADVNPKAFGQPVTLTVTPEPTGFNVDPAAPLVVAPRDFLDAGMTQPGDGSFSPYNLVWDNNSGAGAQSMTYTRVGDAGPRWVWLYQSGSTNRYEPDPTRVDAS
jgi:hypothetical protein